MMDTIMLKSLFDGCVIDIQGNSTQAGALLDVFPPKAGQTLGPTQPPFAPNQAWQVLADPAGSSHHIIQNPATKHCIDIVGNSTKRGASLDVSPAKMSANDNQLWDFIPDQYGSGYFFIQNPQTGYVIEIENGSVNSGALLVVNPRRLFNNKYQLWAGVIENTWGTEALPALTLATPPGTFKGSGQYVLLPTDQTKYFTEVIVTLDIIEDLVADSFSVQINGNSPYPIPKGIFWDAEWMQFGVFMGNNSIALFQQVWHAQGPDTPGDPLASVDSQSAQMLQLENNTVPAGTQIVLTLTIDQTNKFLTGISGKVYNKSNDPIGAPQTWSAVGQATFNPGGPVKESNMAPLGAFQVVIVGNPDVTSVAHITAGLGTITVAAKPQISAQTYWPAPGGGGTAESSNCYYGEVQNGTLDQIAQPFGVPSPKVTGVFDYSFSGTGLLPNSKLTAKGNFHNQNTGQNIVLTDPGQNLKSQNDGSFGFAVELENNSYLYEAGWLTGTVTDADGNWATGEVQMPEQVAAKPSSSSGLGQ